MCVHKMSQNEENTVNLQMKKGTKMNSTNFFIGNFQLNNWRNNCQRSLLIVIDGESGQLVLQTD